MFTTLSYFLTSREIRVQRRRNFRFYLSILMKKLTKTANYIFAFELYFVPENVYGASRSFVVQVSKELIIKGLSYINSRCNTSFFSLSFDVWFMAYEKALVLSTAGRTFLCLDWPHYQYLITSKPLASTHCSRPLQTFVGEEAPVLKSRWQWGSARRLPDSSKKRVNFDWE